MYKDFYVSENNNTVEQCLNFVHTELESLKLSPKNINHAVLMCEKSIIRLCEHADFSDIKRIRVKVNHFLGNITINLIVPGSEFRFSKYLEDIIPNDDIPNDNEETLRNIFLRSFGENVRYKHSRNHNIVTVKAVRSEYSGLYMTIGALILALIAGIALKDSDTGMFLNSNIFEPVKTIFMNGLKLCAIPVVFFATALSFADAGSMSGIKKTAGKVMMYFVFTQITAIFIGFALMSIFRPGEGAGLTASSNTEIQTASVSIISTITSLIPSDIFRPFLEGNMLQVILLALLMGIAVGATEAKSIRNIFNDANKVFMKITEIFIRALPVVVFCSIASLILTTGTNTLFSVLGTLLILAGANILLLIFYWLMVRFIAGLNPAIMYKKSMPALITVASTCSSIASLPNSIKSAESMGIPSSIYSFALPLGITISKNISAVCIIVGVIFTANLYGIALSSADLAFIFIFTLIIVMAAPNIPGGGVVSMSMLLASKGMPLDTVPLFIMIGTVLDSLDTTTVCAGPIAVSLTVSAREKLLNIEAYNS